MSPSPHGDTMRRLVILAVASLLLVWVLTITLVTLAAVANAML